MLKKALKIFRNTAIVLVIFGVVFSNIPFYVLSGAIEGYVKTANIVDRVWRLSHNDNVVDKFTSLRNLKGKWKIEEARAATAPIWIANGTFTGAAAAITPPLPSGIQADDILLLFIETGAEAISITNQSGGTWTEVVNSPQTAGVAGTAGTRLTAFWSKYNGTQGNPSLSDSGNHQFAIISAYRGADPSNPIDVTAGGAEATSDNSGSIPGAITTVDNTLVVTAIGTALPDANSTTVFSGWTNANLSNLTEHSDNAKNTNNGGALGVASGEKVTAGNYGATAVTVSTNTYKAMISIALKPAPDTSPPTSPGFATPPNNISPSEINMDSTVSTDNDSPPVSYYFALDNTNCGVNAGTGGSDSPTWQAATSYNDTGLQSNKCYGYKVKARDSAGTPNETGYSAISSAYTSANTPGMPALGSPTETTLALTNAENSNPASNPTTNFAVQVVTTSDGNWLNKWVDGSGNPSASEVWLTDAQLDALVLQGLQASTLYGVKVKARNNDTDETALSAEGQGTTSAPSNALTVTTTGSQAANLNSGDSIKHIGDAATAAFQLQMSGSAVDVNSVKLTEQGGSITLSDLTNQKMYYESASTCTYNGNESNVSASPSGETVTFSFTSVPVPVSPNYLCLYYVFDLDGTNAVGGETIDIEINNPQNDVALAGGQNTDTAAKQLTGTTTVLPNATSVSYQGGAFPDGAQSGYSATITGAGFGVASAGANRGNCSGAVNTGCVRFTVGGNATVASGDVTAWSSTSITFTVDAALASNGGASGLEVVAGSQADASDLTFYIYPEITSVQNHANVADGNYAREFYDTSDGEGIIRIVGNHFGSAGVVQILSVNVSDAEEDNTTNTSDPAICAGGAYTDTCVRVRVPASIADTLHTGNLKITRDSDTKEDVWTASAFQILPRITALNPNTGIQNDVITIEGNHFCQSGTCPTAGNRSSTDNNVTFNDGALQIADGDISGWSDAASPNTIIVTLPSGVATGVVQIESDVDGVVNDANTATSNTKPFTLGNATPDDVLDDISFKQCSDSGCTSTITTGDTITANTVYFQMKLRVGTSGGTLCPQVELTTVGTAFDGAGGDVYTGTGSECQTSVTANTTYTKILTITSITDGTYHWRARVRHEKPTSTFYYSAAWTSFGGNTENPPTNPAATDFRIDSSGPVVSSVSVDTIGEFSATIHWLTDEDAAANVEYRKSGSASAYFKAPKDLDTSTGASPHAITITDANGTAAANLTCNQAYEFKIIAKDNQNNTTTCNGTATGFCPSYSTFSTFACTNRIMRSVEFYAIQPSGADSQFTSPYTNPEISTANGGSFDVYLEEASPTIKSVFVEIAGVSSGSAALTLTAQVNAAPSKSFLLPVSTTPQPFKVLYQVPTANINWKNSGGGSANELQISFSGPSSVSLTGAKIYMTYHYAP